MFGTGTGGGGFGGFGQQNNQQQQQQQQQQQSTGGFGSTTTGTGFGFGQPAQPQSTGFGSTGFGTGTTTQSSGFGSTGFGASGFGQQNKPFGGTPATTSGGLFGSAATTTSGFGAGTGGFGSGNTGGTGFGSSTTSTGTGLFGSKPTTTGFGSGTTTGTGIFGSSTTANSGFGAAQTNAGGFGATASNDLQPPPQGTANPPFSPFSEKDQASTMTNHFQTIAFQAPYQKWSLEELRLQDYARGQTKAAGPTGFGSTGTTGFGAFGQQQQAGGGFGQTAQTSGTTGGGLFGTTASTGTGFGQTAAGGFGASTAGTGGLFGAKPATTGTGIFGSSTTGTGTTGTGLFGQPSATTGFGAAGNTGGFGQAAQTTGTGLFGAQNQQKPAGFGTGFGSTGTTTGFGQAASTGGGLFGQQQPASTSATTGGLFGTTQQQQQQQPSTGFGQAATGNAFGGFSQQPQQQQQAASTGFGAFGQAQAQTPNKPAFGGFGAASTTPAAGATGGLFGQAQGQAQQPAATGGLFGKPFGTAATQPSAGGLFGQQQQPAAQTGGLFGQPAAGAAPGGLFGQQQQQPVQAGGLFGQQKPAGAGLFGQPAQAAGTGGGLFGSAGAAPQPQGASLFGQPAQTSGTSFGLGQSTGAFGSGPQPAQTGFGGSLFTQAQQLQQPGVQPSLTASIMDQRPYGNVPLLDVSLTAAASPSILATPLSGSTKKKAAMIPHSKIAPRQPALSPRVASPFSRSTLGSGSPMLGGSLGRTFNGSSSRVGLGGSVFDSPSASDDSILNTSAFTPGGNRSANLKRLVIDRNLRDSDLFVKEGDVRAIKAPQDNSPTPDPNIRKTVTFDGNIRSQTASPATGSDLGYMRTPTRQNKTASPSPAPQNALVPVASPEQPEAEAELEDIDSPEQAPAGPVQKTGDYWCIPTLNHLKSLPREKLASVPDLIVGRNNFGQIRFDQPVDLTALNSVDSILGGVITFADRVCTVYPPGFDKPPPGNGLNVPATITLEDCFPTDREHKKPIRDPDHPRYQFHLKRLRQVKDTEFVDYLVQDGTWVFKVKHFTTYGLADEEEDEYMDESYSDTTPTKGGAAGYSSGIGEESSFVSGADITFEDDSIADDTFEFKRSRKAPAMQFAHGPESSDILEAEEESSGESADNSDLSDQEDTTQILPHDDVSIVGDEDTHLPPIEEDYREATPEAKLGVGRNWTDQLNRTISPVKNRVPLGFKGPGASARNPFADISTVDFSESLFASRNRDFEV
ncbi:hypothetical protein ABW19_dt0207668 [Dactylella cylindrospora]|nr:hypothetical protein ABW19_dt0207668 [Dactylella cylindrospora]